MAFEFGMKVDMGQLYAHGRLDDLDLDVRSQWLGRGTNSALNDLDN